MGVSEILVENGLIGRTLCSSKYIFSCNIIYGVRRRSVACGCAGTHFYDSVPDSHLHDTLTGFTIFGLKRMYDTLHVIFSGDSR
jgi:hypothetical protein